MFIEEINNTNKILNYHLQAKENKISPFYLLIPTVLSINLSFMLPIATPTNSIIFASGYVKIKDMVYLLRYFFTR